MIWRCVGSFSRRWYFVYLNRSLHSQSRRMGLFWLHRPTVSCACGALLLRSDSVRSFDLEHGFNELGAAEGLSSGAETQRQICLDVGAKAPTPKTFMRQTVVSCAKNLGFSLIRGIWHRDGEASSLLEGKLCARTGGWAAGTPLLTGAGWVEADQCARQCTRARLWSGRSTE